MVVGRFLDWIDRAPPQARAEAVAPIVRRFFQQDQTPEGREALEAVLTVLLDDPAIEVRRSLAEAIAIHEDAPRHLLVALAQDLPQVAEPVLRRSPCILDSELVEAVIAGPARVQAAIAGRPWVSFAVSATISAEAGPEAIVVLLANPGADLDDACFAAMAERHGGEPAIRDALFARDDLPLPVRQSLIAALGARLNDLLVSRDWVPERRARNIVREACDKATVVMAGTAAEGELADLVEHLRMTGQLTTALLLRSVCEGNIRFMEAALARLSGMPASGVYALLTDGRDSALRALFARAGLPERSHPAFIVALQVWRELDDDGGVIDRARFTRRMIERILNRYQQFAAAEVDDLVAMLRRLAAEAAREAARAYVRETRAGTPRADNRAAA